MLRLFSPCKRIVAFALLFSTIWAGSLRAESTRLLRQPTLSDRHVAFVYGGDVWIVDRAGGDARRLTSTPALESEPHFSPDGSWIAFTSNRSGNEAVYLLPIAGGTPKRLTWYPADASARGWTPDGKRVLYSSSRETAPVGFDRLWTVSIDGGPSELLPVPWAHDGSFSASGARIVVDRVTRWDSEWRHYRGGQNTPLTILDLNSLEEIRLPNERTIDRHPVWIGQAIYFLSDRDWVMNVWSYDVESGKHTQLTDFDDVDVKWLSGHDDTLIFERDGYIHTLDIANGEVRRLKISVQGDFPWAEPRWEEVRGRIQSASLSPTGKRALFEARGEVFTVPAKKGTPRNLTRSSGAADRAPVWSPKGEEIAWFSDSGSGYELRIGNQEGISDPRRVAIGESKMAWEPTWSPDGQWIAFVDDDVRIRVLNVESGDIITADVGGANIERGDMGLTWSPDSKWLAYSKTFPNNLRRIVVWSVDDRVVRPLTDPMADAMSASWDRDGKRLYFLASTNLALGSGWANTSQMGADPEYGVYAIVLAADGETPFVPESDEEEVKQDDKADESKQSDGAEPATSDGPDDSGKKAKTEDSEDNVNEDKEKGGDEEDDDQDGNVKDDEKEKAVEVKVDFNDIEQRVISLPMPVARYRLTLSGPKGTVFVGESAPEDRGMTLHKFSLEDRKATDFLKNIRRVFVSGNGEKLLYQSGDTWAICGTGSAPAPGEGKLNVDLRMHLDRVTEWQQIFDESWRYLRDFFYDPNMHGRDWDVVRERYAPLVPYVRHRADLNYVMDQVSGELSVGHSFVFGGDMPSVDSSRVGVLGADLVAHENRWRLERIFRFENWNPDLRAPLDRVGLKVKEGDYLLVVNGIEMTAADDPYRLLDGAAGQQTVLRVNDKPSMDGSWTVTVEPLRSERALRQRAWVEDNRRLVDKLSNGKLAYVWVPNTGQPGVVSFNRYFFSQQDKQGAVIDERFNGGGLLDDYMVDLMTRSLRAAITNEVPDGRPFRLPAGILGPKVLLINELAGSGGDFFPWVFRQQNAGPLIGTRTWGGLVKSSVHYALVDGGALTAPDNAVFDPVNHRWIAENEGVSPDIEVLLDARSVSEGRDPQLERGVKEVLRMLQEQPTPTVTPPPFPTPAERPADVD